MAHRTDVLDWFSRDGDDVRDLAGGDAAERAVVA